MPSLFDTYFPDHAVWAFREANTNAEIPLRLRTHTEGGRRQIELDAVSGQMFGTFFDRLTITDAGLELNRVRVGAQVLDIRPPLVMTTGAQKDHVANLFPGLVGTFPMASPPYDGTVVAKGFIDIAETPTSPADRRWVVRIASRGKEGTRVLEASFEFGWGGLISYFGQLFGVFFKYDRTDIGHVAPAPAPPHPAPPHPAPAPAHPAPHPHVIPVHHRPSPPPPVIHTPASNALDVWEAEVDENLRKRLIKRAPQDPDLKERLARKGWI